MDTQLEKTEFDGASDLPPPLPTATGFAYAAQTESGQRMSGVIDATDAQSAVLQLQMMRLRVAEVEPAKKAPRSKAIRGDAFFAFNQQLAQLAKSGLPVEQGLRLIATDMKRGRLAATISLVADELDRGVPLGEAFDKHRRQFPSLYGRLVDAGVRSGNLPGVLLNLGRHLEMRQKLRASLWRTISYPLMVLVGLMVVMAFLGVAVLPQFRGMFDEFHLSLPAITLALLWVADAIPPFLIALAVIVVAAMVIWRFLGWTGRDRAVMEALLLPLPLIGPVLRFNLFARWLNAMQIAVGAGMDLPAAIDLAGDATGSAALRRDGASFIVALHAGSRLSAVEVRFIPATIPAAIDFSSEHHDLSATLETLSDLYERQAEARLERVPAVLMPLLVIFMASAIGFVIAGLMAPLLALIQGMTSSFR
ncbi:MAG: type secretion system domain protein [Phycisphaerales bacterium]|nr:type secretion system domain protein [Phycisphaerales bacterium]